MIENKSNLRRLKKFLNENKRRAETQHHKGDKLKKFVSGFLLFTSGVMFGYAWAYIAMGAK